MKRPQLMVLAVTFVLVFLALGTWLVTTPDASIGLPASIGDNTGDPSISEPAATSGNEPGGSLLEQQSPAATATPQATATPKPDPVANAAKVQANELGTVPIIEYHIISDENGRWSRSHESFRQDLERLYKEGFRSISLNDYLDNKIDLPAGTRPVVITFDDSSPGQFTFIKDGDTLKPDPNSAVAMLEQFAAEHPDFGLNATFFVLPAADPPHDLFGQKEYQQQKLRYLVDKGMEIGNHTFWHQMLLDLPDEEVLRQVGQANKVLTEMVPGYRVRAFALPLGEWPPTRSLVTDGVWEGVTYKHDAVLLAGAHPAVVPSDIEYDPLAIPRIQVLDETMDYWLEELATNKNARYVSDGDPNTIAFPEALSSNLNPEAVGNKQIIKY
jgi:peptidoglycan/xylan/chitin deacetylase (PgdA/CDA1 family)